MNFDALYSRVKSKSGIKQAHSWLALSTMHDARVQALSDQQLRDEFLELKTYPSDKRRPKGFALIRAAAERTLGMRHFDVQMIGATVLLQGKLAEMRTGEGKTLTITVPAALLALDGKGVHVVTSNAYLAQRDAELMRPVYAALGLSVSAIHSEQSVAQKQAAYACDVVYGVGSEFGFDYLKDHMVRDASQKVQRGLYAAIVDEVDSVLIDEARVPLIISGASHSDEEIVRELHRCAEHLEVKTDYVVNLKERSADLTDAGYEKAERYLSNTSLMAKGSHLYAVENLGLVRMLHSAVRAVALFKRDRDYVVSAGELVLVDTGTGRKMVGRRFDDGLHEALEAKEGLAICPGTATRATITYQNYFTKYEHLCGLSGTAMTDAQEFVDLYQLETVEIPTNKPVRRQLLEDQVYLNKTEKFRAVVARAKEIHVSGQPLLLGCATIRDAEILDSMLTAAGVAHETLTAKQVEKEAHIIANAGRKGAVTIATNMAGRGTDILLGGETPASIEDLPRWEAERNEVQKLGGLFVLGSERNGIRRVDNQLAGRSGRQGDPGAVQFFLSLEDDLVKVFGSSKQLSVFKRALNQPGAALGGATISKLVTACQKAVEEQGFSARKSLMKYDAALAQQRQAIFDLRDTLLEEGAANYAINSAMSGLEQWLGHNLPLEDLPETWDSGKAKKMLQERFGLSVPLLGWVNKDTLTGEEIHGRVIELAQTRLAEHPLTDADARNVVFDVLDPLWEQQLRALAELKDNVGLKGFTGLNATFQFHNDAFELFSAFEVELKLDIAVALLQKDVLSGDSGVPARRASAMTGTQKVSLALEKGWVARNDPCPCDSGLRFKECHGKIN